MPASSSLTGGYGTVEQQIFNRDYPSYSVGLQLNLPLRNRVARSDLTRDELQKRQTQVHISQLDSQVRMQVGNAQIALQQARKEQARYDEGVDTAYDLIQFERKSGTGGIGGSERARRVRQIQVRARASRGPDAKR
jgi:outer membrane protein TolC